MRVARLGPYLALCGLAALIGIPAALVASAFLWLVDSLQRWLWNTLPQRFGWVDPPWYWVFGVLLAGALLVWGARRFLPGDGGHRPLKGISAEIFPVSYLPSVVLAALGTLAFGAVLGPEAPLIALGSITGVALTKIVKVGEQGTKVLGTAGSFSAISSLFGGPLVAGMLLVESGIAAGPALLPGLLPGFVSAAVGYVVFIGIGGPINLPQTSLQVPGLPVYPGTRAIDLVIAIGVGVVAALFVAAIRKLAFTIEGRAPRVGMLPLLLGGAVAVAALAQLATVWNVHTSDILFSGQASIVTVATETSAGVVLVILVMKGLAYAVSLGAGFRGGPIFPAILMGIAVASVAEIALGLSPTLSVAIGASAGMASATRLLISPVLFAALLVGSAGLDTISASVLAASAAWITATACARWVDPSAPPLLLGAAEHAPDTS